jgi:hypothetical protein
MRAHTVNAHTVNTIRPQEPIGLRKRRTRIGLIKILGVRSLKWLEPALQRRLPRRGQAKQLAHHPPRFSCLVQVLGVLYIVLGARRRVKQVPRAVAPARYISVPSGPFFSLAPGSSHQKYNYWPSVSPLPYSSCTPHYLSSLRDNCFMGLRMACRLRCGLRLHITQK